MTTPAQANLWTYALAVYPNAKDALLHWQNAHGAHVNDLLAIRYARQHDQSIDVDLWRRIETGRPRRLLRRIRQQRFSLERLDSRRPAALALELELEKLDLALLAMAMKPTPDHGELSRLLEQQWHLDTGRIEVWLEQLAEHSIQSSDLTSNGKAIAAHKKPR